MNNVQIFAFLMIYLAFKYFFSLFAIFDDFS